MSGTIVFGDRFDWSASSGVFNFVVDYLADAVDDQSTRDTLRLVEEQNFRWLNLADLSDTGRQQVLSKLAGDVVAYATVELPVTPLRQDALAKLEELAQLAKATTTT